MKDYDNQTEAYCNLKHHNNLLRQEIVSKIKSIEPLDEKLFELKKVFANYEYDYARVFRQNPAKRLVHVNGQNYLAYCFTGDGVNKPSPTIHLTRVAQCTAYAVEVKEILSKCNVHSEKITNWKYCLDIHTKSLKEIGHTYNQVLTPHGQKFNIDICSDIMIRDAKELDLDINYDLLIPR